MSVTDLSENPLDDGFLPTEKRFVDKILGFCSGLTLDLGCGRGVWSRSLIENGIKVVSMDLSIRRLRMCLSDGNNDTLIRSSSNQLPFKSSCFDSVIFIDVIEHMNEDDQNKTLDEIARILKDEGVVIVTTPNKYVYHLLTKYLHIFGYNPEHIHELSFGEAKAKIERHFDLVSIHGKLFGRRLGFLNKLIPKFLYWNVVLIGKKR